MTRTALALAASLLAAAARAAPPAPAAPAEPPPSPPAATGKPTPLPPTPTPTPAPEKAPVARGTVLEEVSGTVREIDRKTYRLSVDTASGPVTLSLDRNTMVYTPSGLATVLDVTPGVQIRAGRNADFLAYWVQVRAATRPEPSSTPGQGTGPAGGGSAPAGESGGAGGTSPPTTVPGGVPPGGTPPAGGAPAR